MSILNVTQREINRIKKSRLIWFVAFIIPLSFCLLICLIFSKTSPKDLPIAVLDLDNSEISRMITRNINTLPSCNVKYKVTDFKEGEKLLTNAKVYGFFVIPENFQNDIYRLKQPKLIFYYNGQRILIGGIISKDINVLIQTLSVGIDAKMRSKKGLPMDVAIKQSNLIKIDDHIRSNPYFNYQYFLSLIAFGHILQIQMLLASVWAIGSEFKYGTAKNWLKTANYSILKAFFGKMIPYFIVYSFLMIILYFIYFIGMNIPYEGNIIIGIIGTILFILTCMSISTIFLTIGRGNFRLSLSSAAFFSAMGFAFAGVTYPSMSMPVIARIYGGMMPLTYYVKIMIDQSLRVLPIIYDIKNIFAMLILCTISLFLLPNIKKFSMHEKWWYKL